MPDHGQRTLHPLTWLWWMQRHYPWSVLWILFMVGLALALAGRWISTLIATGLIVVVVLHSIRLDREERRRDQRKV